MTVSIAWRLPAAVILAVALLVPATFTPNPALACSCAPLVFDEHWERAAVAFRGEVEEIRSASDTHYEVEFDVEEYWKGQPARETFVYTYKSSATCGATFVEDREYFVLARDEGGRLEANSCLFTYDYESGGGNGLAEIQALGEGTRVQDGNVDDDDPPSQEGGDGDEPTDDGDEPTDDGDGAGGDDNGDDGANGPGEEDGNSTSEVDPDPMNVGAVVLAGLVAAGAVVVVAGRK